MKITKRQLRDLIREALSEGSSDSMTGLGRTGDIGAGVIMATGAAETLGAAVALGPPGVALGLLLMSAGAYTQYQLEKEIDKNTLNAVGNATSRAVIAMAKKGKEEEPELETRRIINFFRHGGNLSSPSRYTKSQLSTLKYLAKKPGYREIINTELNPEKIKSNRELLDLSQIEDLVSDIKQSIFGIE